MASCFIIAEAGVNHNGSMDLAKQLIEVAAQSGADAVKFQTFKADEIATQNAHKAEYQKQQTGEDSQREMLRKLELPLDNYHELVAHCQQHDIEFMSTAFDPHSLDFLLELGMKRIKVPSGEITNTILLEHLASKDLPIILSTGMSTLDEVNDTIQLIADVRNARGFRAPLHDLVTVLHCTSNYPTSWENVNLKAMLTLQQHTQLPIGYSDHTPGILIAPVAVGMGATVIEKHFTVDRNLPGPDHQASLEPQELTAMVNDIRNVEQSLGTGIKQPTQSELAVRDVARRSITLGRPLKQGEVIAADALVLRRPGNGIQPRQMSQIIGKILQEDLEEGTTLHWSHLESA